MQPSLSLLGLPPNTPSASISFGVSSGVKPVSKSRSTRCVSS
jgi:hypothetical protein